MPQVNMSDELISTLMDAVQIAKNSTDMSRDEWDKFDEAYTILGEILNT